MSPLDEASLPDTGTGRELNKMGAGWRFDSDDDPRANPIAADVG